MASGVRSACASIGSRSSTPYRRVVLTPLARSARVMTSRMTGPRRLPTWTVPDGVFESLTTCGPTAFCASSSAQSMATAPRLADADDLVREVASGDANDDLFALLLAEEGTPDGALVGDPALGRLRLGGTDDGEALFAIAALDRHRRADLDVVGRDVLVDDRGVLDQGLEGLDPPFDERLLVLGVLVLGVLRQVAVLLGVVDPVGDLGTLDRDHLVELDAKLLEAVPGEVGRLVVHGCRPPSTGWSGVGRPACGLG